MALLTASCCGILLSAIASQGLIDPAVVRDRCDTTISSTVDLVDCPSPDFIGARGRTPRS
jgi:hypothetical protein